MTVIDVEIRALVQRSIYSPSYARRTDRDRAPATVVARPNDYAPTREQREAESARRMQAITAKRVEAQRIFAARLDAPKTYLRESDRRNAEKMHADGLKTEGALLQLIAAGSNTFADLAKFDACSLGNARRVVERLSLRGLVNMDVVAGQNEKISSMRYFITLTDAGRAHLAGLEP